MIFVKWIGIVVVSVALVYLSLWLGGGWGELLVSASPLRVKLMEVVLSAAGAVAALLVASEMDDHIEFFEDWLFAEVILVIVTFVFGAVTDPLVTYGLWPWQWMTWWAVLPLPFAILTCHRFYLAFRHDLEFRRYLASKGLRWE